MPLNDRFWLFAVVAALAANGRYPEQGIQVRKENGHFPDFPNL
jgi:hypothetical protein